MQVTMICQVLRLKLELQGQYKQSFLKAVWSIVFCNGERLQVNSYSCTIMLYYSSTT